MTTDADRHRDSAKEHIKEAIKDLNEILVLECHGHDHWDEDYRKLLFDTYITLLEVRTKL